MLLAPKTPPPHPCGKYMRTSSFWEISNEITICNRIRASYFLFISNILLQGNTLIKTIRVASYERHRVSNHRLIDCLFTSLCRLDHWNISKPRITVPFREEPVTGGFPSQRASDAFSMLWRHQHAITRSSDLVLGVHSCSNEHRI